MRALEQTINFHTSAQTFAQLLAFESVIHARSFSTSLPRAIVIIAIITVIAIMAVYFIVRRVHALTLLSRLVIVTD